MQVFVGEERRLANAFPIEQPESPLKRGCGGSRLFEQIRVGPIAHALRQPLASFELAQDVGRTDVGIVHGVPRRVARAPLGEVQWQTGKRRRRDLLADTPDICRDCLGGRRKLIVALAVFVEEPGFDSVRVRRDEINAGATLPDVRQKLGDPGRPRRGRTSDPQGRIDRLERLCGQIVQIEIRPLVSAFPKT